MSNVVCDNESVYHRITLLWCIGLAFLVARMPDIVTNRRRVNVKAIEIFGRQLGLPDGMVKYQNLFRASLFLDEFFDFRVISGPYRLFVGEILLFADMSHKLETSGVKRGYVLFSTDIVDDCVEYL